MKFLNFLLLALGNQRGELDLGESESTEVETDNQEDLSTEGLLASLESEETESESGDEPETESSEEGDLESMLNDVESESSEGSKLLEELNGLGILHKGLPVEFDDPEKVKELLSKGYDYTQKTQEVAELRKTAEAEINQERETFAKEREEFESQISEHNESINNYQILQKTIAEIQKNDPELFEELDSYYTKHESSFMQAYNNPVVSKLQNELAELRQQVSGNSESKQEEQLNSIKQTWETELKDIQSTLGPKLRSLGIKPDWKKVQDVWGADSTNQMTVKKALFAEYGEHIQKALSNKSKINKTKAEVARAGTKPDETEAPIFGMETGNSYEKEAFALLKDL